MRLWLKIKKLWHFMKELIKDFQIFKSLVFATLAVPQMADELILTQNEKRQPSFRMLQVTPLILLP